VIKCTKNVGQISQVRRNFVPRSVLNAADCNIAETWMILHSKQKHDLSPLPEIANELQKGRDKLQLRVRFFIQLHKNAMIESAPSHVIKQFEEQF